MKKIIALFCVFVVGMSLFAKGQGEGASQDGKVKLVVTSWRTEDIERMERINEVFTKQYPNIEIDFQPVKDTEYDSQVKQTLAAGVGADIIFLRSYDSGYQIYKTDSLMDLDSAIPALKDFPSAAKGAWATPEGTSYGIPAAGVVHGVYYRKSIFKKYGLEVPKTWDEFMTVCQTIKDGGDVVFAQGTKDDWMLYEVMYSGLGANFYGGEAARQKLLTKEARITDPNFVLAFEKMNELKPFFPKGYEGIDYVTMQQMFGTGNAAMFMGGSWEIGIFEDLGGLEDVGYFAPPLANSGDTLQYCFHVDMGIGVNKNSKNLEAAKAYINWLASPEYAQMFMNEVPGFFSYTPGNYTLENSLAKEMQSYIADSVPTVRTLWEKLSAQAPSGNQLMGAAVHDMYSGAITPEEAAKKVDDGLSWFYQ